MAQAGKKEKLREAIRAGLRRDYRSAVAILEETISETDPPREAFLYLGRSFHALRNYSRALAAFKDYARLAPDSSDAFLYAGRTYLMLNLPKKAVPLLEKALALKPSDPDIKALLGIAFLKARRSRAALDTLEAAVTAAPENPRIYRAYLNALLIRGIRLIRRGDAELGSQMLRFLLDNGMDLPLLRLELARACRNTGRGDEALEHYSKALEFSPHDPTIRWYRASILMSMGMTSDALSELEYLRSLGAELPEAAWNSELVDRYMIRAFYETGQWRPLVESCRAWVKQRGADPVLHIIFSQALEMLGNFEAARNHLDRALELKPGSPLLWEAHILLAWKAQDFTTLRKALTRAKKLMAGGPFLEKYTLLYDAKESGDDKKTLSRLQDGVLRFNLDPDIMYALGETYLKIGLIEESLGWFEKIKSLDKENEKAYLGIIAAHEALFNEGEQKTRPRLEKAYKNYLELWPDNRILRREWAVFLVKNGNFAAANTEFEKLLIFEPGNLTLRRILAYSYRKTQKYREAAVLLKRLLAEKPGDIELLLEFSGCLARAGSLSYAEKILEKAMNTFRKSADIPMALGLLYFRDKRREECFDMLGLAAGRNPQDPRPYEWMAVLYKKTGKKDEALHCEFEAKKRKEAGKRL